MIVKGTSNPHHDDCDLKEEHTNATGMVAFWCAAHHQWTYLWPVSKTYSYAPESGYGQVTLPTKS